MAEQGEIVMPTVGATGRREQLSSNESYNEFYRESNGGSKDRMARHPSGAGFTSNQRAAVYEPSLDLIDNPQFGLFSQTKRDNQHHTCSNCSASVPNLIYKPTNSSFHQLRSDSKTEPVERKTEYQKVYVSHPVTARVLPNHVMGSKQKTGFTEGTDRQLYTFDEKKSSTVEPRQTHNSVTKTDFPPPPLQQGTKVTPNLCSQSCRESGYTRGVVAPFAWPSSLLPSPQTKSSAPTEKTIGKKEPTGFLRNVPSNQVFPKSSSESSRFITHYGITFCHRLNKLRSDDPVGFICAKKGCSYRRDNKDRFTI